MITAVCPGVLGLCNLYFIRNFLSCLKCLNTVVEKSSKYDWQLHWLVSSPDISNVSTPFGLCSFANILWKCSGYSKNWNIICPFFNSCKYCHWSYFVFSVSWNTFFFFLPSQSNWGSCVIILIHQKWRITWEHSRLGHFNWLSILIIAVEFCGFFL